MTEVTIKRLEDCTDEDLLSLTEEQIEDLINLECAHESVRLLPEAPVAPNEVSPQADFEFFEINALQFVNKKDAEEVAALVAGMDRIDTVYERGPGYTTMVTGTRKENPGVTMNKKFSEAYLETVRVEKQRIEERKKAYDDLKTEYDNIANARSTIIENVLSRINEARNDRNRLNQLRNESHRYLKLSMGDKEIAQRFMTDAFPDAIDLIKEHFEAWAIHHVTETMKAA